MAELKIPLNSYEVKVEGMHCASCVSRVEKSLINVLGVEEATANIANGRVKISAYGTVDSSQIVKSIKEVGYKVFFDEIQLKILGMSCAACVGRIEKSVKLEPGVIDIAVNLANNSAKLTYLKSIVQLEKILAKITELGYEAVPPENFDEKGSVLSLNEPEQQLLKQKLILAVLLTLPVFFIEMSSHVFSSVHELLAQTIGHQTSRVFQFALTTVLLLGPGNIFLKAGFRALWRLSPDMNSLVAIGTTSAWGYSVIATFIPGILPSGTVHVYYESAAVIVTLILFGRYLESRAKGVANNAIRQLVDLAPKFATVLNDGKEIEIPVAQVKSDTIVKIKPGEKIPVDGVVESGDTYVDESLISGEPIPKLKQHGDEVIGGTINQSGSINIRATSVGADSVIARIIQLVEDAQLTKLPVQAMVDRVTAWFVPIIIVIAIFTFFIWLIFGPTPTLNYAIVTAVAVLIIACPCAMGLATPTSIIVGTGRAATLGILFRNGTSLEQLKRISILAVDKTGTLTEGYPKLREIIPATEFTEDQLLLLAASVESNSEHPVAKAICQVAKDSNLKLEEVNHFDSIPGRGVSGTVNDQKILLGSELFLRENGVTPDELIGATNKFGNEGHSIFFMAIDGKLAGALTISDPIKETTRFAIEAIKKLGLKVVMLTGDNKQSAEFVGKSLGIDEVYAELLPKIKLHI